MRLLSGQEDSEEPSVVLRGGDGTFVDDLLTTLGWLVQELFGLG